MQNVFLVDDDRLLLDGLTSLVPWESLGLAVSGTAKNGREALEMMRENPPDMLITDISMPELTGLQLAREALALWPHLYVLLITGYADFTYAQEGLRIGVKDYILKPIDYQQLTGQLAYHMEAMQPAAAESTAVPQHMVIRHAMAYIDEHVEKNIGLAEVADAVHVSAGHLSRLFKLETKESFSTYLNRRRMEHVRALLDDPSLKIFEIAQRMGFHNMTYFHARFKEVFGVTPGGYRKRSKT